MIDTEVFILAGGHGRRLASDRPKALTDVAGRPILDHLLSQLNHQGFARFSVALGAHLEPFATHFRLPIADPQSTPRFHSVHVGNQAVKLRLLDTGQCDTGGRLGRLRPLIRDTSVLTWCDALSDVQMPAVIEFHRQSRPWVSVVAVNPSSRFGQLQLAGDRVVGFEEKPRLDDEWISSGYFVIEPDVVALIDDDHCSFERDVLPRLADGGRLNAWRHRGFWQCMDTPGDRHELDRRLRQSGKDCS